MDEMGHQIWSDARDTIYFVPSHLSDRELYYTVPRAGKRITLIACISVDGSYVCPALVISRQTFEDELFLHIFTSEKVELYSQTKTYKLSLKSSTADQASFQNSPHAPVYKRIYMV
jgi:hypothetical protein